MELVHTELSRCLKSVCVLIDGSYNHNAISEMFEMFEVAIVLIM